MILQRMVIVMLIVGITVSTAQALLITADADGYSDGADISTAFAGMTLSSVGPYPELDGFVYARTSAFASTGKNVFGNNLTVTDSHGTPSNQLWYQSSDHTSAFRLRVDFDNPANYVAIDMMGNNSSDYGILEAYNSSGNILTSVSSGNLIVGNPWTAEINLGSYDIAYVISSGVSGNTIALDSLRANVIPEPATVLLLSLGAVILKRRR